MYLEMKPETIAFIFCVRPHVNGIVVLCLLHNNFPNVSTLKRVSELQVASLCAWCGTRLQLPSSELDPSLFKPFIVLFKHHVVQCSVVKGHT